MLTLMHSARSNSKVQIAWCTLGCIEGDSIHIFYASEGSNNNGSTISWSCFPLLEDKERWERIDLVYRFGVKVTLYRNLTVRLPDDLRWA
jgi:hypothetical protein